MRKLSDNITGAYLSELRKSKGFTQEQLAKIMHMHKSTIAHYEQGVTYPDLHTLELFADFYNVSTDYILGRTNYKDNFNSFNDIFYNDMNYFDIVKMLKTINKQDKLIIYRILKLLNQ